MDDAASTARRLWVLAEHVHAVTYFAPEARAAYEDAGIRGFWRGYFAGRSAPMGRVGAGVVEAVFYGFHHDVVARALPSVWDMAEPEVALRARADGAAAALRAVLPEAADAVAAEAGQLMLDAIAGCAPSGRPLFAANVELAPPADPWARLWHATTLWREHRGDGHVAALVVAGIDGCESHVLRLAVDALPAGSIQPARGWSDEEWADAAGRLVARGLVDGAGAATPAGRALHTEVETRTDDAATPPVRALGTDAVARVEELLAPLAATISAAGQMPYPNPIGVAPPA